MASTTMIEIVEIELVLRSGKKVYFNSDFEINTQGSDLTLDETEHVYDMCRNLSNQGIIKQRTKEGDKECSI